MKNIFTLCALLISFAGFAQQAGTAGELLKNEASQQEMQKTRGNQTTRSKDGVIDNSNYRKPPRQNRPNGQSNSDYRWNYNYGNSEVFLRIPEYGNFHVELGDQIMGNQSGKFRFFDLRSGSIPIAIYENNYLLYRTRINVRNNTRLVLDFFTNRGLYLLGSYPIPPRSYGVDEWDDIWNNPYGNYNGNYGNPGNYYGNVMNDQDFNNLMRTLDQNGSFDNNKSAMINAVARNTNFTSLQIQSLLNTLSFEDNKLVLAKELYAKCIDRQNFFLVFEVFSFERSKRELSEFISRN